MATYLQRKEKRSLFHRRRRVHTISIILSCLVDSAVIRKDNNSSVRNMDQISDLYKYEPNHGHGTYEGDSVFIWQSRWRQISLGKSQLHAGCLLSCIQFHANFTKLSFSLASKLPSG